MSSIDFTSSSTNGSKVKGPAISLIVVASICLLCLVVALVFDVILLSTGLIDQLRDNGPVSRESAVYIRMIWSLVMVAANSLIIFGAVQMLRLKSWPMAMTACVVAVVPCIGPCFILGAPFGIWGPVVLNQPDVRRAFQSIS